MSNRIFDPELLKSLYAQKKNVMQFLRDSQQSELNTAQIILAAYDMQAGSYSAAMHDPSVRAQNDLNTAKFARLFDELGGKSVLHGGTGEAKTLVHVIEKMARRPRAFGFDISFSRLLFAKRYAAEQRQADLRFFVADLAAIPVLESAFDIVFTSHSMEPNGGQEKAILRELYRCCRNYLVLREPAYDLGGASTRAHIERHRYVTRIPDHLKELGFDVVEHSLFGNDENPNNQSALTVVRKKPGHRTVEFDWSVGRPPFASPISKAALRRTDEAYYSPEDCLIFPLIGAIPCLLAEQGVFSTKYGEFAGEVLPDPFLT